MLKIQVIEAGGMNACADEECLEMGSRNQGNGSETRRDRERTDEYDCVCSAIAIPGQNCPTMDPSQHTQSSRNRSSVQELDAQQLKQELDIAHSQLEEYAASSECHPKLLQAKHSHVRFLVASLYNELRIIREIICPGCKEKVLRRSIAISVAASASASESQQSSSRNKTPRPASSGYRTLNATNISPSCIPIRAGTRNPRSYRNPRSVSVGQQIAPLVHGPDPPTTPVPLQLESTVSMQKTPRSVSTHDVLEARPDWSIEYNPEVKKIIEVKPVRTIAHVTRVWRAKFSNDGEILAVIHRLSQMVSIYCVSTGTKIWQVLQLFSWLLSFTQAHQSPGRPEYKENHA
jgi:hypothetical protein